ncbi:VOC family protein [Pseudotabrizicola sp.]|uniref:VOC family protein n=2 Tax=Pseudotabrizicola sp. TaxID=2939647 RepID=UPI00271C138C|nr:VOC family protein [Pseudotabrizicola sp.]MDO8882453.1 VOC family protein [Pseudotabrizicola sp.]MDP2082289.1 VOC family protein [Pseudotabrizicola sp.]
MRDGTAVSNHTVLWFPETGLVEGAEMSASLGRLVIYTSRIDEMADFYAKHFGFSVLRADNERIVELRAQNSGLALLLHPAAAKQKEGQVLVKLVFDVEDVSAFCEAAKADGVDFGKIHKAGGYEFANAKDPSKNSIQVSSRAFRQ